MKENIPDIFAYNPDDTTDKWYKVVRERNDFANIKRHIIELWNFFYTNGLSDPHFSTEFPVRLFHRWWEMEVAWLLSKKGFELKSSSSGPDFTCIKNGSTIYVEAVTCEPGEQDSPDFPNKLIQGPHIEGEFKVASIDLPAREGLELLRLRNSIEYKVKQYQKHKEKGLVDPQTPYVIALSPVMIPDMIADDDGIPAVVKAVYPVGQIYLSVDRKSSKVIDGGRSYRPKIQKHNKTDIYTNIFLPSPLQDNYEGISGILYSPCSFKNSLYLDAMRNSFVFIHNYISCNPLKHNFFGSKMDFWIEDNDEEYILKNNLEADVNC